MDILNDLAFSNLVFRDIFRASPNLYLLLTPEFKIVDASDSYIETTMVKRCEIVGKELFEVFPDNPDDPHSKGTDHLRASLERVLLHKKTDVMAIQKYDVRRPISEGGGFEERHWSPLNSPVFDSEGRLSFIIHRVEDVTDFVKLKRQGIEQIQLTEEIRSEKNNLEKIQQSQRLEAMGALAGGVAHDFNNILAIITLTSENILKKVELLPAVYKDVRRILECGERAATLTRQLLAFSRQQVLPPKVVDLNAVLSSVHDLLSRLLGENIDFKMVFGRGLSSILIDQGQLEQVILNLVVNARDSMPAGGEIKVETLSATLEEEMIFCDMKISPGSYVVLSVQDSGMGMDAKTQARIFEPFFTTKAPGSGTGLGLSTVYGIVRQIEGAVRVVSEPNKGSTFNVYFPVCAQPVVYQVKVKRVTSNHSKKGKTILVVEDQEYLREVMATTLHDFGYKVLQAKHGVDAIAVLVKNNFEVDLIIADVVMPEMGGIELSSRLRSLGKKIKTLFISGFTGEALQSLGDFDSSLQFLEKPFNQESLISKVKSLLDADLDRDFER